MPNEDNKVLKYNHGGKSMKVPFIIYADLESLLEKTSTCHTSPKKSSTTKVNKHTPSGYSLFTHCSFDATKNKLDYYRGKDFCKDLRKHAAKIVDYEKKEIVPLTIEKSQSYHKQKACHICKKGFSIDDDNKKYHKVRDHCHYAGKNKGVAHQICNLRYKTPKEITVVLHNGSTYDYYFIIKELAEEFQGQFECIAGNKEKYITFSVPIKKELDNGKTISYKLKIIDNYRFMSSSLSNLADNFSDGLHNNKCINCKSFLDYMVFKDDQLTFRCFECKKNYQIDFNNELTKRLANIYEFCNGDINKFILLLRKDVFPYEYMDSWERILET